MARSNSFFLKIFNQTTVKRNVSILKIVVFILLFSSILQSCSKSSDVSPHKPKWLLIKEAEIYELEDKDCTSEEARKLGTFTDKTRIWILDEYGNRQEVRYDLTNYSLEGLRSEVIKDTIIDHQETIIESKTNLTLEKMQGGRRINFCREDGGYHPDSLENVALASVFAIDQAYKAYKKVGPKVLNKISLYIHPIITRKNELTHETEVKVNSAEWGASLENNNFNIIAYPMEKSSNLINLWENPAVLAHEYGHHIFYHHAKKMDKESYKKSVTGRFLNGSHEGFADLFSIYSLRLNGDVANPKIYYSKDSANWYRDIDSNRIKGKEFDFYKIFDGSEISYLENPYSFKENELEGYIRQEEHIVGSIFAFTFNQVLKENGYGDQPEKQLKSIISWLDRCETDFKPKKDPKMTMNDMLRSFVEENSSEDNKDTLIKKYFPYYDNKWNN